MLHVTNGESTKSGLERSGVPGRYSSWDDILHEGPTPLVAGEEWLRVRAAYLGSAGYGDSEDIRRNFRVKDEALTQAFARGEDEVVFWFEHDLYDQLLMVRHLWWVGAQVGAGRAERAGADGPGGAECARAEGAHRATRLSIVIGNEYLGLLKPEEFPARFERRRAITDEEIALGTAVWVAYCGDDPRLLVPFADLPPDGGNLPPQGGSYLGRALRRLFEEFPSAENGLSRSERQILDVLSEGARTPEQAFVASAQREEDIWMGDWSFWTIVKRLSAGPHPLLTLDVQPRPGRLPEGTLDITSTGRRVLAGRADQLALNAPSRWIGGTLLSPDRPWRWTGSAFLPPAA